MSNDNFTCKYCSHHSTITPPDKFNFWRTIDINQPTLGQIGFLVSAITCPNLKCKKLTLIFSLSDAYKNNQTNWEWQASSIHQKWQLLPESEAKVLADYIPIPIQEDYYEACRIRDLSAKASATLSRRCLQGMIRDFWKISKATLKEEIDELQNKVDSNTWEAIDSVRSVGNIGAHMEKDIDLIIDVDPEEAQLLIELIEQLTDDWYVQKHEREERMKKVKQLAEDKKVKKSNNQFSTDNQTEN